MDGWQKMDSRSQSIPLAWESKNPKKRVVKVFQSFILKGQWRGKEEFKGLLFIHSFIHFKTFTTRFVFLQSPSMFSLQ
jgi:hypothetical protein